MSGSGEVSALQTSLKTFVTKNLFSVSTLSLRDRLGKRQGPDVRSTDVDTVVDTSVPVVVLLFLVVGSYLPVLSLRDGTVVRRRRRGTREAEERCLSHDSKCIDSGPLCPLLPSTVLPGAYCRSADRTPRPPSPTCTPDSKLVND